MKYLKEFENHLVYSVYAATLDETNTPNVSLCIAENEVHYNPKIDPYGGHEYVDLGLPSGTLWATMNVGATSITDHGNYYKYGSGTTLYESNNVYYQGNENPVSSTVDTATQVWGGNWHTPTETLFEELISNTTYEWTTINGINGGKFTAQNGNYVFFPASGRYTDEFYGGDILTTVWSSTPNMLDSAFCFVSTSSVHRTYSSDRYNGRPIRPVYG